MALLTPMFRSSRVKSSAAAHTHDRMPLTLPRSAWGPWLDPDQKDGAAALALAQAAALSHFQSQRVNNSKHEDPRCIDPIAQEQATTSS